VALRARPVAGARGRAALVRGSVRALSRGHRGVRAVAAAAARSADVEFGCRPLVALAAAAALASAAVLAATVIKP